jgi:hypothetical protein
VTSAPVGIYVGTAAVTLGAITLGSNTISAYGTDSVSVPVLIGGANATVPIAVTFTSNCTPTKATLNSPVTNNTSTGIATSTYKDNGCAGIDSITASVTSGATATAQLTVATPTTNNIQFVSATPEVILTGGQTSVLVFEVRDQSNNGKAGVLVDFSLVPDNASLGISLSVTQATSLSDGTVTTSVLSGAVPTPLWVVAKVHSTPTILTQSEKLTITTGLPTQNFFSLSISTPNIEGWRYDGVTTAVSIIASDRLADPVPDGTVINFIAEGGHFGSGTSNTATCLTIGGACTVTFMSAAYRPVGETTAANGGNGAVAALEYDGVTPITINGGDPLYVQNGRVTILGYALGEMSFVDSHGTNMYQPDDTFSDMGQLFVDSNENGILDSNPAQPNLAEQTIGDVPGSAACGVHIGGSATATAYSDDYANAPSAQNTCSGAWGQTYVRRDGVIIFSGSSAQISQNNFTAANSCFGEYTFWLMDENYNPMPAGTTVGVNSILTYVNYTYLDTSKTPAALTAAAASVNVAGTPVLNSTHAGGTPVTLIISGGTGCIAAATAPVTIRQYPFGPVAIDVTTPKGNITTIPISIE